jgi:hypothetical protein
MLAVLLIKDPTQAEKDAVRKGDIPDRVLKSFKSLYYRDALSHELARVRLDVGDQWVIINTETEEDFLNPDQIQQSICEWLKICSLQRSEGYCEEA